MGRNSLFYKHLRHSSFRRRRMLAALLYRTRSWLRAPMYPKDRKSVNRAKLGVWENFHKVCHEPSPAAQTATSPKARGLFSGWAGLFISRGALAPGSCRNRYEPGASAPRLIDRLFFVSSTQRKTRNELARITRHSWIIRAGSCGFGLAHAGLRCVGSPQCTPPNRAYFSSSP